MGIRLTLIVWVTALRFLAHATVPAPSVDAPPPPTESRLVAVDAAQPQAGDDNPFDVDDRDDDESSEVALPAAIGAPVPAAVTFRISWPTLALHDECSGDRLFRPPRRA